MTDRRLRPLAPPRCWRWRTAPSTAASASARPTDNAGEIVFNTAITGYQEVLTDPSYRGQIVLMTAPEIGNVGVNPEDFESARPCCAGLRGARAVAAGVRTGARPGSLDALMAEHGVAGISGIDTRAVTRRIRIGGAQRAVITRAVGDPAAAVAKARRHPSLEGRDLVVEVTCARALRVDRGLLAGARTSTPTRPPPAAPPRGGLRLRHQARHPAPAARRAAAGSPWCRPGPPAKDVLALKPDGIFLSNGPGDPAAVDYAVEAVARASSRPGTPTFGICLGHQILGLALGGKTYKLKFGHHGANHPVMDLATRKVEITSQNHGFAVDVGFAGGQGGAHHVNLNDKTVEGMRHDSLPVFSVQYHPEASPGPNDASYLFDRFVELMDERTRTVTVVGPAEDRGADAGLVHSLLDRLARAVRRASRYGAEVAAAREELLRPRRQGLRGRRRAVRGAHGRVPGVVRARAAPAAGPPPVPRAAGPGRAATASSMAPPSATRWPRLCTSHRSLFELETVQAEVTACEDLLAGARFTVRERRSTIGFAGRRHLRGAPGGQRQRLHVHQDASSFTRATPRQVHPAAGRRRRGARGADPATTLPFTPGAGLHQRWHRQGHLAAARVYGEWPQPRRHCTPARPEPGRNRLRLARAAGAVAGRFAAQVLVAVKCPVSVAGGQERRPRGDRRHLGVQGRRAVPAAAQGRTPRSGW